MVLSVGNSATRGINLILPASAAETALILDQANLVNHFIEMKTGGTAMARFSSIVGQPGLFAAPGYGVFFSTNDPFAAAAAFTFYNPAGILSNVANNVKLQVIAAPLTWLDVFDATYGTAHTFTNHRTAATGDTWVFNNAGTMSGGNMLRVINAGFDGLILDYLSNLTILGAYSGYSASLTTDLTCVNGIFSGYNQFAEMSPPAAPAADNIRLYSVDHGGFSVINTKDSSGYIAELGQDSYVIATNNSGGAVAIGAVVYLNGAASGIPTFNLADPSTAGRFPAFGVVAESIANGSNGRVMTYGKLININTAAFATGNTLYLGAGGTLTTTRPTAPSKTQVIGYVTRASASGVLFVTCDFGQNDLTGTVSSSFTVGNTGGGARDIVLYNGVGSTMALRGTPSAARVITFPNLSGTVGILSATQSWTSTNTFTGQVLKTAGIGSARARPGGPINVNTTAVGNVGAGEDDLISYTVPANTLNTNGDFLDFEFFGTFAANANNKTVKCYFGATNIFNSGAQAENGGSWKVSGKIIRTGAATQKAIVEFITDGILFTDDITYTATALTLSSTNILKCTGEATADNDIVNEALIVNFYGT